MIRQGYCLWQNLPTMLLEMRAPVIPRSSSIAATIPESFLKKMLKLEERSNKEYEVKAIIEHLI